MPWALAAAAVTAGAGLLQSNAADKASKNAINAQNAATDKQIQAQQQALQQITALQQPYINAGYGALGQLGGLYGYGSPGASASGTAPNPFASQSSGGYAPPAVNANGPQRETAGAGGAPNIFSPPTGQGGAAVAPTGPTQTSGPGSAAPPPAYVGGVPQTTPGTAGTAAGPDWNAYLQANPDVAARAQQGVSQGIIGPGGQWATPQDWAAYQYQNTGQAEGRQLPTTAGTPGTPATSALAPADQALSNAVGQRPTFQTPNFGTAPDQGNFFSNFQQDPGYQFALSQGLRATNASYGARGLLKSDAAIKGVNDYAQGMANQQYGNWWNRQNTLYNEATNQFNNDRSANYNIFNTDRTFGNNAYLDNRDYATNRYDNTANNLFRTVSLGTGAAASVGGANSNFANAASNIYGAQGSNNANAALANGATQSQLIGNIAGIGSNLLNLHSLSGQQIPTQTIGSAWGNSLSVNPFTAANANIVSQVPTYSYGGI